MAKKILDRTIKIGEKISFSRDFTGDLATGDSVVSGTASCLDIDFDEDVSATLLTSTTASRSGNVLALTKAENAGLAGRRYRARLHATTNNSEKLFYDFYFLVES